MRIAKAGSMPMKKLFILAWIMLRQILILSLKATSSWLQFGWHFDMTLLCLTSLTHGINPSGKEVTLDVTSLHQTMTVACDIGAYEIQLLAARVAIDIKPGNKRNVINPRAKGGVWVAILSDSEFDPLQIKIPTVRFGPDEAKPIRHKVKDVNKDGLGDLLLRFKIRKTGIECVGTEATLTGETFGGTRITDTDSIKTVGCKKEH